MNGQINFGINFESIDEGLLRKLCRDLMQEVNAAAIPMKRVLRLETQLHARLAGVSSKPNIP